MRYRQQPRATVITITPADNKILVSFPYDSGVIDAIKKLPSLFYSYSPASRQWIISRSKLQELLDNLQFYPVKFNGDFPELKKDSDIKNNLKTVKPCIDFNFKGKPFSHQIAGFNFLYKRDGSILGDAMGCGKTAQCIYTCDAWRENDKIKRTLIISKRNIREAWIKEINRISDNSSILIDGSPAKRKKLIESIFDNQIFYTVVTYDVMKTYVDYHIQQEKDGSFTLTDKPTAIKHYPLFTQFDCVILDEAHLIKTHNSQRTKALLKIKAKKKICVTGTPVINRPEELWSILKFIGEEKLNYYIFYNKYVTEDGHYKNLQDISDKLRNSMIRRKKEDVLDLPPITRKTLYIDLNSKQKRLYKEAEKGILKALEEEQIAKGKPLSSMQAITKLLRLRQITSHPKCVSEDIPSAKEDALEELLKEIIEDNGEKVVVFSQFLPAVHSIESRFRKYNPVTVIGGEKSAQQKVDTFQNDSDCKLFIGSLKACREGLTLTKASYCIFVDLDWSEKYNEQAEDRLHRIGQENPVTIIRLMARDTIDTQKIEEYLKSKKILVDYITDGE